MPNLTQQEMSARISAMGLKRRYKPVNDPSNSEREKGEEVILLETRKMQIADGTLKGAEVDIYDDHTVRVWTHRKKKAADIARSIGCKVRLLDGEAELYLPAARADEFLHGLGVKVKSNRKGPVLTPEQRAKALAAAQAARKAKKAALATAV